MPRTQLIGSGTLQAGESTSWYIYYARDPGIMVFHARNDYDTGSPVRILAPAELKTSDVSFHHDVTGFTYYVTITHMGGWSPTFFKLYGVKVN